MGSQTGRNLIFFTISAVLAGTLLGCPKKLTEKVVVEVPKVCPPAEAPKPHVGTLKTVATVSNAGKTMAVLANTESAIIVSVGDRVGSDNAKVLAIGLQGVTLSMPDGSQYLVKTERELGDKAEAADKAKRKSDDTAATNTVVDAKSQRAYARWRISVMEGVSRHYGTHFHVLWALGLAFSSHQSPVVANAINNLGWTRLPGIGQAYIKTMSIKRGTITAEATAATKRMGDMLLSRIRSAHPLLSSVTVTSDQETATGYNFSMKITAPIVSRKDLVIAGTPGSSASASSGLNSELTKKLSSLANRLPTSSTLPGHDNRLKELAKRAQLEAITVSPVGNPVEEGYLGMVSFSLKAIGNTASLLKFVVSLRQQVAAGRPVVIDPLHITGKQISMVLRIPYVTGHADTRKPIPGALILPRLRNSRWAPAVSLPVDALRDPFTIGR